MFIFQVDKGNDRVNKSDVKRADACFYRRGLWNCALQQPRNFAADERPMSQALNALCARRRPTLSYCFGRIADRRETPCQFSWPCDVGKLSAATTRLRP